MLFKIIVFLVLAFVIYYFFIRKLLTKEKDKSTKNDGAIEMMVECDNCGIFVSSKEAILSNGKYYCSKNCLNAKK